MYPHSILRPGHRKKLNQIRELFSSHVLNIYSNLCPYSRNAVVKQKHESTDNINATCVSILPVVIRVLNQINRHLFLFFIKIKGLLDILSPNGKL